MKDEARVIKNIAATSNRSDYQRAVLNNIVTMVAITKGKRISRLPHVPSDLYDMIPPSRDAVVVDHTYVLARLDIRNSNECQLLNTDGKRCDLDIVRTLIKSAVEIDASTTTGENYGEL